MLRRFIEAQCDIFNYAYTEIKAGRKRSHWMWLIFPQIKGLGRSCKSMYYGLNGADEAREYLSNPILGKNLREITNLLLELPIDNPHEIFRSPDDMKLQACMTLFDSIEPNSIFQQVLDKFFHGQKDKYTLSVLNLS